MWIEWIHDPKMLNLTLAEKGAWWLLVSLAGECAADGDIVKGNGTPMSLDEIAVCLHINSQKDRKDFFSMLKKMEAFNSLNWISDILTVTNFSIRQSRVPSETKEAVRDRVRRYREGRERRQVVTENPLPPLTTPSPSIYIDKEKDIDIEGNGEKAVTFQQVVTNESRLEVTEKPLQNEREISKKDKNIAKIAQLYEENIGFIKPVLADEFREFCENFTGTPSWIELAFKEAISRNKKSWHYIRAILESLEERGGPDDESKPSRRREGKPARQTRRTPIKYIRGDSEDEPGEDQGDLP